MEHRDSGIILRLQPLTETSLIVRWITRDEGRISTVAKGARRSKSPFQGKLDLYYEADFTYVRSRQSTLHNLRELGLRETNSLLRRELVWLHQSAYAARIIEQNTEEETPIVDLFSLFTGFVRSLPLHSPSPLAVLSFEFQAMALLGWSPELSQFNLQEGDRGLFVELASKPWIEIQTEIASPQSTRNIAKGMSRFMSYHLHRIPEGRNGALGFNP